MKEIVGESLARRLIAWGVDTVFGLPGDGINGLMEGFRRCREELEFVLVHHEEAAAFMATGYAKATGRLGVCCATSGPGAIHLLNGLYDAKLDHAPVLAITGMQETSVLGTRYQQEVHLDRLFQDVAEYNLMVTNPQQMPGVVDIAIRNALSKRGVAHLTFPNDIQVAPVDEDPYRHVGPANPPSSSAQAPGRDLAPDREQIRVRGRDPQRRIEDRNPRRGGSAACPGRGIGRRRCARRADRQDAPRQGGGPRRSPAHHGRARFARDPAQRRAHGGLRHIADGRDVVPVYEASAPPRTGQGGADRRRSEPRRPPPPGRRAGRRRRPQQLAIAAPDARRARRTRLPRGRAIRDDQVAERYVGARGSRPIPDRAAIPRALPRRGCRVQRDPDVRLRNDRHVGRAALARPRRPPVLLVGEPRDDGARPSLRDPRCSTRIPTGKSSRSSETVDSRCSWRSSSPRCATTCRSRSSSTTTTRTARFSGNRSSSVTRSTRCATKSPKPTSPPGAWACGAYGAKITDPASVAPAIAELLAHRGPGIIDCRVNPNEPPMPAKVSYEQAKHFTEAFLRGQPHKVATLATIARDKISELSS